MHFKRHEFKPQRLVKSPGISDNEVWTTEDWVLQPGYKRKSDAIQDINNSTKYRFFDLDIFEYYLCKADKSCRFDRFSPADNVKINEPVFFKAGVFKGWVIARARDAKMFVLITKHRSHWTEYGKKIPPIDWNYCEIKVLFPDTEAKIKDLLDLLKSTFN